MPFCSELEQYSLLKAIGFGSFGRVFLVKQVSDGQLRALKIVSDAKKASQVERWLICTLKHPFVVCTERSFVFRGKVHLCMEHVGGGNLRQRLEREGRIPLSQAKLYLAEVALGLSFLHQRGIVYRDLKSENVMLGLDGHVKLVDFGLSIQSDVCYHPCGTAEYQAPEMVRKEAYGQEVDWWALGILFYELLFGRTPFFSVDRSRQKAKILKRGVVFPERGHPREVCSLIVGLLAKDRHYRFGFEDVVKHCLMSDVNFEAVSAKLIVPEYVPGEFEGNFESVDNICSFERESFQSGDGQVGESKSCGSWRCSEVLFSDEKDVKSDR
jgi:protein kinase A